MEKQISKKEFLARAASQYDKRQKGIELANKLEKRIAKIRAQGYKLIVLGNKVKITYP